ncbi:hypothetical protein [Ciceribacter azotifigens]|uniref:hypothetical protein n=1 Tax=Ciceribacter azotifigens TaxID=2069303 RepID=UPI003A8C5475
MAYSAADLQEHPRFVLAVRFLAEKLRGVHDGNPRIARFLASQQRWLLSQAAFALHNEYDPDVPRSGLTISRLRDMVTGVDAASRNTVLNFLNQLEAYRFMRVAGDTAKRPRRFEPTEVTVEAMFGWLLANLAALDQMDGGARAVTVAGHPELFRLIQPRAARQTIGDARWREPPPRVAMFLWTESGGLVMDELMRRVGTDVPEAELVDVGRIDARTMAETFRMSRTHLQRLLNRAISEGCLVRKGDGRKDGLYLSRDFLQEYLGWQAIKFAAIDDAYQDACRKLNLCGPEDIRPAAKER